MTEDDLDFYYQQVDDLDSVGQRATFDRIVKWSRESAGASVAQEASQIKAALTTLVKHGRLVYTPVPIGGVHTTSELCFLPVRTSARHLSA